MESYVTDMLGRRIDLANRVPCRAKSTVPMDPAALGPRKNTVIYWLGGGGFLIDARGTLLLFDPVLEMDRGRMQAETGHHMLMEYPISTGALPPVDMVFYTHPDLDHVGPVTSGLLAERRTPRTAPARVAELLYRQGALPEDVTVCRAGQTYSVKNCTVETIPADHPWQLIDPAAYGRPLGPDDACGYVIRTPDGGILLPGDTRLLPTHYGIPGIDVVLVDTAKCAFHLNVEGALLLCNAYESAYLIPYHYGMFDEPTIPAQENGDPQDVFRYVRGAEERARILAPGEPFVLADRREVTGKNKEKEEV